ncbi:adenine phosphoribosyltransferase [Mycoplasmopsis californica]|uniref:Adenine phosphoribosyltransferase n=1 Tax=Mycoplasmopsis equigenitalium TaxID=114883 RepID=A0ABY5J1A9_9BACT|nr:adenine phosphoribosyltransferase [Mycoplasmopsis equigenitalium]UUD37009.1 adenine phosphoribosyltransferase [Mycoplasmopsis equigenitalium]VEU69692.1 adenine phosphoribosyltransferase [Mycoplasmopsis californica]
MSETNLGKYIRDIKDFPKKGILFKDISPLLANGEALKTTIDKMAVWAQDADVIVGPDARGFLFGTPVAYKLGKPFVMVRKPNKLPGEVVGVDYELEYGTNKLELQKDFIKKGQTVVIVDDVLATGGTTKAIIKLLRNQGAIVKKVILLMELVALKGRELLENEGVEVQTILKY